MEISLHLKDLHPGQIEILSGKKRFNTLCCGRRWGKTTLCEELLLGPDEDNNGAISGFPVAYFAPTYKMLMEVWREITGLVYDITAAKSETEKRIQLIGGGVIDFWSLEDPDTIRGRKYKRIIVDEAAIVAKLQYAWHKVMRPMLTDMMGDAWFLSTPKGKNNYFYNLFNNAEKFTDWSSWQMPTSGNPFIENSEIEEARLQVDPLTFAQEYLASFVTENLDAWAYCYNPQKHIGKTELNRAYEVKLSFDFNRNPITCGVFQDYGDTIMGIEQIKLDNADIYKLCDYINAVYGGCMFIVTGDATGKASSALVKDNINYYTVIKAQLNLGSAQFKVPSVNPSLQENRVLVNSILHNKNVVLDREKCKGLIFDLEHAQVLPDGTLDKSDRKDPTKQLDACDCFRYYCNAFHKHVLKQ